MKHNKKKRLWMGIWFLLAFLLWTALIRCVDVQAAGPNGTKVGFAAFNLWFHHLTGVHMSVYTITDWLGLVPIAVCLGFGVVGVFQLIRRKSLIRVDPDILLLGLYYVLVILAYLIFEMIDPDQLQADPDRWSVGGVLPLFHDASGPECDAYACVSGGQKM